MKVTKKDKGKYIVTPPTFRVDITREIDLIEEIIRIYGYDSVPATLPNIAVTQLKTIPRLDLEERIRQVMNGSGYGEIINYSFITPDSADYLLLPESDERRRFVRIKNPLVEDQSIMRTTMIYGLLDTLKRNFNNGSFNLKVFELGRIFLQSKKGLPEEMNMLAGLLAGARTDDLWGSKVNADFFDLKGCLENVFFDLKLENCQYRSDGSEPFLHPGKSCKIFLEDTNVGYFGEIHPQVIEKFDMKNTAYVFEINLDILTNQLKKGIVYKEVSKFPAITRDVAFVVPAAIEADYMVNSVLSQKEDLLENVVIFDIYQGKEISEGTKSIGLRFSYRAADRTLTDIETNRVHDRIIRNIVKLTNAKIRG
jgi:phenylalanyl-tRNA synthetase beta chain